LLSGVLADRALARRGLASDMLLVSLWTVPFAAPFVAGFVTAPTVGLTMLSAAAMNFLLSCAVAPCLNYAVTRANPQDRGLTSTMMLGATGLIGGGLGPFLVGVLSDYLQPSLGAESLHYALGLMIASPLLAALFIAVAWRQARRATF
jgi:MFS family permease